MTKEDLLKIIKECPSYQEDWNELIFGCDFDDYENELELSKFLESKGIKIKYEDQFGGMDQGSVYWYVFSCEHNRTKTYFKLDGWYASHYGSAFPDEFGFYQVRRVPVQAFEWKKYE